METSIIFYGVLAALVYVILQSLFIIGIRAAAKGGTEILPNGKHKDSEMILYPIFKYLTRTRLNKIYYSGTEFSKLMDKIQSLSDINFMYDDTRLKLVDSEFPLTKYANQLKEALAKIDPKIQLEIDNGLIRFYKMDEEYVVWKYLRKPIIQCPICMSSFWSIFSYWIPIVYLFGMSWEVLYLGGINICIVACLNWLIWVKGHANEAIAKS